MFMLLSSFCLWAVIHGDVVDLSLSLWNGTVISLDKSGLYSMNSQKSEIVSGIVFPIPLYAKYNSICDSNFDSAPNGSWIALMARNGCPFEKMILKALSHGASGVIIWAQEAKVPLFKIEEFVQLHHTTALVNYTTGEFFRSQAEYAIRKGLALPNVTMTPAVVAASNRVNGRSSLLFVCVAFVVLMCIALAWLIFYYVQRFHTAHKLDHQKRFLYRAAAKALSQMKTRKLKATDPELSADSTDQCAVCLDGYKEGDTLRFLSCSHSFHKQCVDPWLLEHRSCPMCKTNILEALAPQLAVRGTVRSSTRSVATSLREALFTPSLDLFTSSRGARTGVFFSRAADRVIYVEDNEDVTLPLQPDVRRPSSPGLSGTAELSGDDRFVRVV